VITSARDPHQALSSGDARKNTRETRYIPQLWKSERAQPRHPFWKYLKTKNRHVELIGNEFGIAVAIPKVATRARGVSSWNQR
jgi:hypothetical protein